MVKSETWKSSGLSGAAVETSNEYEANVTLIELNAPETHSSLLPPFGWPIKNIKAQRSGLSISLSIDRCSYNANDSVQGTLRIQAPIKSKLKLGLIEVRIIGFEGNPSVALSALYTSD